MVSALVRGLEKKGGRLLLNSHVERILSDDNRSATGVVLRGGGVIKARKAVVSSECIGVGAVVLVCCEQISILAIDCLLPCNPSIGGQLLASDAYSCAFCVCIHLQMPAFGTQCLCYRHR